jgi:citrate lyase subunit beta/citryl-CoA lyase
MLFVPATSPDKAEKALASAADAVIVDLEDAVAVAEKPRARENAALLLKNRRSTPVYLRVNALTTPFCFDDLATAASAMLDGIIFPKAETASEIATVDWVLTQWEAKRGKPAGSIAMLPILETARGIAAAAQIGQASKRVRQLMFGAVDFALDLDIDIADETGAMAHARFAVALASRQAGLAAPLDTVFTDIRDLDGLRAASNRARAMGFGGKACIHPGQIATINEVFSPSAAELTRAREIVAAFDAAEASGAAAVSVGGVMVDYPVVEKARRVLASARDH